MLKGALQKSRIERFKVVSANAAVEFVEHLDHRCSKGNGRLDKQASQSTTRAKGAAASLYADRKRIQKQFPQLDNKCFNVLKKFEKVSPLKFILS